VSEKQREERALRTIVVSARAALAKADSPEAKERIQDRVHELLADLEEHVMGDGADPNMLAAIEQKRRQLYEVED